VSRTAGPFTCSRMGLLNHICRGSRHLGPGCWRGVENRAVRRRISVGGGALASYVEAWKFRCCDCAPRRGYVAPVDASPSRDPFTRWRVRRNHQRTVREPHTGCRCGGNSRAAGPARHRSPDTLKGRWPTAGFGRRVRSRCKNLHLSWHSQAHERKGTGSDSRRSVARVAWIENARVHGRRAAVGARGPRNRRSVARWQGEPAYPHA